MRDHLRTNNDSTFGRRRWRAACTPHCPADNLSTQGQTDIHRQTDRQTYRPRQTDRRTDGQDEDRTSKHPHTGRPFERGGRCSNSKPQKGAKKVTWFTERENALTVARCVAANAMAANDSLLEAGDGHPLTKVSVCLSVD
jgi:hypothetical protein